jgi:hypothetical protein
MSPLTSRWVLVQAERSADHSRLAFSLIAWQPRRILVSGFTTLVTGMFLRVFHAFLPGRVERASVRTPLCILGSAIRLSFGEKNFLPPTNNKAMETTDTAIIGHQIVSRDEWAGARKELLRKEKELTRIWSIEIDHRVS